MMHGFTAENWKHRLVRQPSEDSFQFNEPTGIIAVADGITRDPMEYLPDLSSLVGKLKFTLSYPRESPAKIAADIFTMRFRQSIPDCLALSPFAVMSAFKKANESIKQWNLENMPNPDYVTRDFAGCVASAVVLDKAGRAFHWGFVTDCGLCLIDKKGNIRFKTPDEGPGKYDKIIWEGVRDLIGNDANWRMPVVRRMIREHYRNNPREVCAYGALTGECTAMDYVRTGTQEIKPTDTLLVYSDGISEIMFNKDGDIKNIYAEKIQQRDIACLEKLCKQHVHSEGTLVYYTQ